MYAFLAIGIGITSGVGLGVAFVLSPVFNLIAIALWYSQSRCDYLSGVTLKQPVVFPSVADGVTNRLLSFKSGGERYRQKWTNHAVDHRDSLK